MSEGELKKRITKWYDERDYRDESLTPTKVGIFLDEASKDLVNIIAEIENNATEDTLFERMVLYRLKTYSDYWHGTKLEKDSLKQCVTNRKKPK